MTRAGAVSTESIYSRSTVGSSLKIREVHHTTPPVSAYAVSPPKVLDLSPSVSVPSPRPLPALCLTQVLVSSRFLDKRCTFYATCSACTGFAIPAGVARRTGGGEGSSHRRRPDGIPAAANSRHVSTHFYCRTAAVSIIFTTCQNPWLHRLPTSMFAPYGTATPPTSFPPAAVPQHTNISVAAQPTPLSAPSDATTTSPSFPSPYHFNQPPVLLHRHCHFHRRLRRRFHGYHPQFRRDLCGAIYAGRTEQGGMDVHRLF